MRNKRKFNRKKFSPLYTEPSLKRHKKATCKKDLDGTYRWNGRLDGGKNGQPKEGS